MIKEGTAVKIIRDKSISISSANHFLKKGSVVVVAIAKTFVSGSQTYEQYVVEAYGKDFIPWDDRSRSPNEKFNQAVSPGEIELISVEPAFLEEKVKTGKLPNI